MSESDKLILPHELHALREMVVYTRAVATQFPDAPGDTFAARQQVYAQIVEDLIERIEAQQ